MNVCKKKILSEICVNRNLPKNIIEADIKLFESELHRVIDDVYLYEFNNCSVDNNGIVSSRFKIFEELLIWPSHKKDFNLNYLFKKKIGNKIKGNENIKYFLCFDYWSPGYFHWICEALPRIMLIEHELKKTNSTLLLPIKFNNGFYKDSLKIFGDLNITWIPDNTVINCHYLLSPNRVAPSGSNNPKLICELKKRFLTYFDNNTSIYKSKNIYVSRFKAKRRKIINEDEVIALLLKYDFEIIYFEDHSFQEQVQIIRNANNLVSIHGANLTNLLFLNERANVLELRKNDDFESNYYFALAEATFINYYYQLCNYEIKTDIGNDFNLCVDMQILEINIKKLLKTNGNERDINL